MDISFLVVVAIALAFLSAMVVMRLGASGAAHRRTALLIGELWVAVALWIGLFSWLGAAMGRPAGAGGVGDLRELPARFAGLPPAARLLAGVGTATCIALVVHLLRTLGKLSEGGAARLRP